MPDQNDLVDLSGRPLIKEPKLVVIKAMKGVKLNPAMLNQISQMLDVSVLQLPMDSDFLMGKLAQQEVASLHAAIHTVFGISAIELTDDEAKIVFEALKYVCAKTAPPADSPEIALLGRLQLILESEEASQPQ